MSRSGYDEDYDGDTWDAIRWRGIVASASKGQRGQLFFRDLLAALDAMPEKRLIGKELETADGNVCVIGALGKARGVPMADLDPEDSETVAWTFNIADALAREVVWVNDDCGGWGETPEHRFVRVRKWVASQIKEPTP